MKPHFSRLTIALLSLVLMIVAAGWIARVRNHANAENFINIIQSGDLASAKRLYPVAYSEMNRLVEPGASFVKVQFKGIKTWRDWWSPPIYVFSEKPNGGDYIAAGYLF